MIKTSKETLVDLLAEVVGFVRGLGFRASMRTWMEIDLTMAQLKALFVVLWTDGLTSRALADRLGVLPSAVTPLVDALAAQKLVRREPDPADRRVARVRATAKARALRDRLMAVDRGVLNEVAGELAPDEVATIASALRVLGDAAKRRVAARSVERNRTSPPHE